MKNLRTSCSDCLESIKEIEQLAPPAWKTKLVAAKKALRDLIALHGELVAKREGTFAVHSDVRRETYQGKRVWSFTYRDGARKLVQYAPASMNREAAGTWFSDWISGNKAWQERNRVHETGESLVCTPPPKRRSARNQ